MAAAIVWMDGLVVACEACVSICAYVYINIPFPFPLPPPSHQSIHSYLPPRVAPHEREHHRLALPALEAVDGTDLEGGEIGGEEGAEQFHLYVWWWWWGGGVVVVGDVGLCVCVWGGSQKRLWVRMCVHNITPTPTHPHNQQPPTPYKPNKTDKSPVRCRA